MDDRHERFWWDEPEIKSIAAMTNAEGYESQRKKTPDGESYTKLVILLKPGKFPIYSWYADEHGLMRRKSTEQVVAEISERVAAAMSKQEAEV